MRILFCNKFYYRRGGDCIYTINLEQLLKDNGHETAIFAMDCPESLDTPWHSFFPSELSFDGMINKLKYAGRCLGIGQVSEKFRQLLDAFRPDVVHLNNIHSQLSPIIALEAHKKGIRVVWTLHDYKLLCPRYDCLKRGERPCELCFTDKMNVLKHSCMKNSFAASSVAFAEAIRWNKSVLEKNTDLFICPSLFMKEQMRKGGFAEEKLVHLCNSIDVSACIRDDYFDKGDYYCFVGRLSHEKGIRTLIEAASLLPRRLIIIGGGPLAGKLPSHPNIEFAGYKSWPDIKALVGRARFTVVPSEWYENNPLSVIESLCLGTPVLGARIGGIPELIDEDMTGYCFESGDAGSLGSMVSEMFAHSFDYKDIAEESQKRFSQQNYYADLLKIYSC